MRRPLLVIVAMLSVLSLGAQDGKVQPNGSTGPSAAAQAPSASAALLAKAGFEIPSRPIDSTDFTLDSISGGSLSLASFKGKLVFLNFWATWCGPCNIELPAIAALSERLKSKGLVVLAVDLREEREKVETFVKAKGVTFPVALDRNGRVGSLYGISGIPTTYVVDRTGKILGRKIGVDDLSWDSPASIALFEKLLAM
jgi:thiol-disulfide isomerase/thioredoxin